MTHPAEELPLRPFRLPEEEFRLFDLFRHLATKWRIVATFALVSTILAFLATFVLPPVYTASTSFVPERTSQRRLPSALGGIADQLGISLPASAEESPRFYEEILRSRSLGERLLTTVFANPREGKPAADSQTLLTLLRTNGWGRPDSVEQGLKKLESLLSIQIDNQTRIVRLDVKSHYPAIAAEVANQLVDYLNKFNAETRQSQARERREFIEGRIEDAGGSLREAEDQLKRFYEANRSWQQSPQLTFEEGRLRRYLEIAQEVYLSLRREYESARIDEVNDTPVLTVIDRAVMPRRRSFPGRGEAIGYGLAFGLLAGISLVFGVDYWQRASKHA